MNLKTITTIVIFAFAVTPAFSQATKPTEKELEGAYSVKQVYEDGKFTPLELLKDYLDATIANGELTIRHATRMDVAKFKVDPTKKIAEIDFTSKAGDTQTVLGIYMMEKDLLTIVFNKTGTRPVDFKATAKDSVKLELVRRPKEPPKKDPPKK